MRLQAVLIAASVAAVPVAGAAATLEAFAGITIRLSNLSTGGGGAEDGGNLIAVGQSGVDVIEDTDGDGTASLTRTLVGGVSPVLNVGEYLVSPRVNALATAGLDGYGEASGSQRIFFDISRANSADAFIDIALEPLDGLGGQILNVFGRADRLGDIGSAFARITLERSDFEGVLFSENAFVNLFGLGAGDFDTVARSLIPSFELTDVLIPRRQEGDTLPIRFTLDLNVSTTALVEPAGNGPAVIPLPPAAPLLAFGIAALFGLRRLRAGGRSG